MEAYQMAEKRQSGATNETIALIKRANRGDATPEARAAFRKLINDRPERWRLTADMLNQAQNRLIETTNGTGAMRELMLHGCEQLKRELTMDSDGALEKMLVDVVVFAWLRLSIIEQHYNGAFKVAGGIALTQGIYWEKRLNAAHKRFENACVNLARVRRLMRPPKVKNSLSVGTINALLSGNYGNDTLGALLKNKPGAASLEQAK
jgi:hypothetical protein